MEPTYSEGAGGVTGCRARTDICAVEGCKERPRPRVCIYDGTYHRHGAMHYGDNHPSTLKFRKDGWFWVCDKHHQHLSDELIQKRSYIGRR